MAVSVNAATRVLIRHLRTDKSLALLSAESDIVVRTSATGTWILQPRRWEREVGGTYVSWFWLFWWWAWVCKRSCILGLQFWRIPARIYSSKCYLRFRGFVMAKLSQEIDKWGRYLWWVPASADRLPRSAKTCATEKYRAAGCMTCGFPMDKPVSTCG